MSDPEFKYDVAFTLLAEDESVAREINAQLMGRLSTFLYSEQQKELAGKDGVEAFTRVFAKDARIVVFLHRGGWGDTKWTRIEATAIKSRGWDTGFTFLFVIRMDKTPLPEWIPRTKIWFDLSQYGPVGAAAAIEERAKDAGGEPHEETPESILARLATDREAEQDRVQVLYTRGRELATEEAGAVFDRLEKVAASSDHVRVERAQRGVRLLGDRDRVTLGVGWESGTGVGLEGSCLGVVLWKGYMPIDPSRVHAEPPVIGQREFAFSLTLGMQRVWLEYEEAHTTEQLVRECVRMLTDQMRGRR